MLAGLRLILCGEVGMGKILTIVEHDPSGRSGIIRTQTVCSRLGLESLGIITSLSSQQKLLISNGAQLNLPINKEFIADQITSLREFDISAILIGLVHQAQAIDIIIKEASIYFPKAPRIFLLANGSDTKNNVSSEIIKLNQKRFLPCAYVSILPACCSESITDISVFDVETALQASKFLSRSTNGIIIVLFEEGNKVCCTISLHNSCILFKDIDTSFGIDKKQKLKKSTSLSSLAYDIGVFIASIFISKKQNVDFTSLRKQLDKISKVSKKLN